MNGIINIDGKDYEFKEGETILSVARRNNIHIPVLCYLKDIAETGACRICLVEVEGVPMPLASCSAFAADGMVVRTNTDEVKRHRLKAMEFILLKHPLKCSTCENSDECMLRELAKSMGISEVTDIIEEEKTPTQDWNMMTYDQDLCVLCMRCVNVCSEVAGCNAIEIAARGNNARVAPKDEVLNCDFCGICVDVCPVGAIKDKPFKYSLKIWELDYINTSCSLCPVGCNINYGIHNNIIHRVRRVGDNYTCSKGRYGFRYLESKKRVLEPIIKVDNEFVKSSWHDAMEKIYKGLTQYGAENSLIVGGGWLSNEELYNFKTLAEKTGMMFITEAEIYFGKFARKFKEKFGHYESFGKLSDIENSDVIFVIGADFARENVGIKWSLMKAVMRNNAKVITIGLQRYDYDENTFLSLIADYADFAGEFEKIKHSDKNIYAALRKQIENNKKISIIAGNEYFCGEESQESILAFADFIGEDKLSAFIITNDKLNYVGNLYAGGLTIDEVKARAPKAVFAMAVNPGRGKNEELLHIIANAEFYATPDLFVTGTVAMADVVLPVQSVIETDGTATSLDGRLLRMRKVVDAPAGVKSNSEICHILGDFFRKKIEPCNEAVFRANAERYGFSPDDWNEGCKEYKDKEKVFNKTDYTYIEPEKKQKIIYVNPRHHEGALTKIIENDMKEDLKVFPNIEKHIEPGSQRSHILEENIAKGVKLIPR